MSQVSKLFLTLRMFDLVIVQNEVHGASDVSSLIAHRSLERHQEDPSNRIGKNLSLDDLSKVNEGHSGHVALGQGTTSSDSINSHFFQYIQAASRINVK